MYGNHFEEGWSVNKTFPNSQYWASSSSFGAHGKGYLMLPGPLIMTMGFTPSLSTQFLPWFSSMTREEGASLGKASLFLITKAIFDIVEDVKSLKKLQWHFWWKLRMVTR